MLRDNSNENCIVPYLIKLDFHFLVTIKMNLMGNLYSQFLLMISTSPTLPQMIEDDEKAFEITHPKRRRGIK